jgi:hypothetical protein
MFTEDQVKEFIKCKNDPVYFINNYVKIGQLVPAIKLYDYQEDLIRKYHNNRFCITKACRQSGKSSTGIAYILHYIIFNNSKTVGLFTFNKTAARSLFERLKEMYLNLPTWMRCEIWKFDGSTLELENGSSVFAFSVDSDSSIGITPDLLFLDEFAFVKDEIAKKFWDTIMPVVYSRSSTKLIISSTPFRSHILKEIEDYDGNIIPVLCPTLFYELWIDAITEKSRFVPTTITWPQLSYTDEIWKEKTISNIGKDAFELKFECKFSKRID